MEWNDDQIAALRRLWAEGRKTAEIGTLLGCSKNAAVGKAHRLGLEARPSPIQRDGGDITRSRGPDMRLGCNRPPRLPIGRAPTLPPLPSAEGDAEVAPTTAEPPATPVAAPMPAPVPSAIVAREAPKPYQGRVTECAWVEGTRGRYTYCSDPTQPGSSYCAEHHKLVWKPAPKLRVTARLAAA